MLPTQHRIQTQSKSIVLRSLMLKSEIASDIQVELRLVPGLPGIRFLGLPDQSLRESETRIRSALRASGYQFPKGRMLLVDILPRDGKKHGRGLDLPVSIGFLLLTGQLELREWENKIFYGDISLAGQITAPFDWLRACLFSDRPMITGQVANASLSADTASRRLQDLADGRVEIVRTLHDFRLEEISLNRRTLSDVKNFESPTEQRQFLTLNAHLKFTPVSAKIAAIAAAGGHPTLLAGPQGSGKSTLARVIHYLRPGVSETELRELELWSGKGERPLLEPHHSASLIAMVGGGNPVRPGIVTKAHFGSLLMDEVLLFKPEVQESLREPLETGRVCLARGTENRTLPAEFQLLGTTNLCQCGRWTPDQPDLCACSSRVRSHYEGKLRGPFVDRFQLLVFTATWNPSVGDIKLQEVLDKVDLAHSFQKKSGRDGNRRWYPKESELGKLKWIPKTGSERRRLAVLRVARTIADLDLRDEINEEDLRFAVAIALDTFQALQTEGR
jgi:magnesium chelatase family protein